MPVSDRASTSATLSSVRIGPGSIWKPSRGPSSLMSTWAGRSDMAYASNSPDGGAVLRWGRCLSGVRPELSAARTPAARKGSARAAQVADSGDHGDGQKQGGGGGEPERDRDLEVDQGGAVRVGRG